MDFRLTSEQSMLRDSLQRLLRDAYGFDDRKRMVADGVSFSRSTWRAFADLGLLAAGLPEEYGGWGGGSVETAIIMEELGRHLVVEPYLESAVISTRLLISGSVPTPHAQIVAAIVAGERIVVPAFMEDARDPEYDACVTSATQLANGTFRLAGSKIHVAWGGEADDVIVLARLLGQDGSGLGRVLLLVKATHPGIARRSYETIDGRQAADIDFDDVLVAGDALIAGPDRVAMLLDEARDHAVAGTCAESVGCMEAMMSMTATYLTERRQFGRPLADFQVLQHRMAEMFIETDFARSVTYLALAALNRQGEGRAQGVSAAKVRVDAASQFVAGNAVHNHGGIGITEEYPVGHYFRRLLAIRQSFGGTDYHFGRCYGAIESNWGDIV